MALLLHHDEGTQDMSHKIQAARELQAQLEQKCAELTARTSALIDFAGEENAEERAFIAAMIQESANSVAFWTDAIVKAVQE